MSYLYTAIIIEPRKHPAMHFVLKNFLENLDERWGFIIFHGTKNDQWLRDMINSEFSSDKNRIQLNNLNLSNISWKEYNKLCSNSDFIEKIPTEQFLIFQVDTSICNSEKNLIYDFLKYDYVGAPWLITPGSDSEFCGKVGNGGLSLRRKSKMLEVIEKVPYPDNIAEDEYYCIYNKLVTLNRPTYEEAQLFSMETVYSGRCFGIHKPWLHEAGKVDLEIQFPGYNELVRLNSLPVPD